MRQPHLITRDLVESYEDALRILDDSLEGMAELIRAQQNGERIPDVLLAHLKDRCTAAAVGASNLREKLERFKTQAFLGS